jgi:tripartite-type tricarboxylate transporter receptor subunit TctC
MKFSVGVLAAVLLSGAAAAQTYPARQVRFVVGFPPGGGTDVVTRLIAERMTDAFKQQVIVDNRPGAASNIAAELVAGAPADGYTIFMGTISTSSNRTLYRKTSRLLITFTTHRSYCCGATRFCRNCSGRFGG